MLDFPVYSLQLSGIRLYAFGLVLAGAAVLNWALLGVSQKRHGLKQGTAAALMALVLPLGLFCARLVFALVRAGQVFYDPMEGTFLGISPFFRLEQGGYSFFGLLLGVLLALLILARLSRQPTRRLMDWAAPPLALFCSLLRFAQILGGGGYGEEVLTEGLQFFPLAVQNAYGEWVLAVFVFEGLVALVAFFGLWKRRHKQHQMPALLTILTTSQIFLESLRQDAILRLEGNGFIRVSQVLALAILAAVMAVITRQLMQVGKVKSTWTMWPCLLLGAAAAIAAEFYEKLPLSKGLLYGLSFGAQLLLCIVVLRTIDKLPQQHTA
ncbi:MAG: hypothetical protein GX650_05955 [Clostridiales bacterium]|jgi:prolipoprotein diacylglyceryltransferase|nr:hypothetical protein [Clostridiales bacterium]